MTVSKQKWATEAEAVHGSHNQKEGSSIQGSTLLSCEMELTWMKQKQQRLNNLQK